VDAEGAGGGKRVTLTLHLHHLGLLTAVQSTIHKTAAQPFQPAHTFSQLLYLPLPTPSNYINHHISPTYYFSREKIVVTPYSNHVVVTPYSNHVTYIETM
jgi:hypothetical protein